MKKTLFTIAGLFVVSTFMLSNCTIKPQLYRFKIDDEFSLTYQANTKSQVIDKNKIRFKGNIIDFSYKVSETVPDPDSSSCHSVEWAESAERWEKLARTLQGLEGMGITSDTEQDMSDRLKRFKLSNQELKQYKEECKNATRWDERVVSRADFIGDEIMNWIEIHDVPGDDQATIILRFATSGGGQMVAQFNLSGDVFTPVSHSSLAKSLGGVLRDGKGCSEAEALDSEINQLPFQWNGKTINVTPLPHGNVKESILVGDSPKNCYGIVATTVFHRHDKQNKLVWSPHQSRRLWVGNSGKWWQSSVTVLDLQNAKNLLWDANNKQKLSWSLELDKPQPKFTFEPVIEQKASSNSNSN
jgi:hypothetical protein